MPSAKKTINVPIGTTLDGKYRVTREIGRGGMASIYEAVNVDIGKHVAVKVLNPELTHSTVVVERFLREARAAAAVKSPYICDVYDAGRLDDGRPFLVLELLLGESLYERMVKVRRFEPDFVARAFAQVARGLTKAHEGNIIHRDLKPENIFITKGDDGEVLAKIVDFGLAKFYAPVDGDAAQQRLTREGAVFGTPAYMSPEQVKGQGQVDHRADLWAIGCMVYECLVGRTVWATEQGVAMIFAQIATAEIPIPSRMRPDLPPGFDRWFFKALNRDPDQRFQTAKELADELAAALGQGPPSMMLSQSLADIEFGALQNPNSDRLPPASGAQAYAPTERPPASDDLDDDAPTTLLTAQPHLAPPPSTSDTTAGIADTPSPAKKGSYRAWIAILGALAVGASGYVVWDLFLRAPKPAVTTPAPTSSLSATASASQRAPEVLVPPRVTEDLPDWAKRLASGQEMFFKGDVEGATEAFRTSVDGSGSGIPRVMLENARLAAQAQGACEVSALGRPRPYGLTESIRRPAVAYTTHGTLVTWADDHEVPGQWHAYTLLLDGPLRGLGNPVDVSPEASSVQLPGLFAMDNQVVLLFGDQYGRKPGVFVRRLTTTGRILGAPIQITDDKGAVYSPSLARSTLGGFWVAYADDGEKSNSSKLYVQYLTPDVKLDGKPKLVAEYADKKGLHRSRARSPSVAAVGNALLLVYRVELGRDQNLVLQRIALDDPKFTSGLIPEQPPVSDRVLGEAKELTDKKRRLFHPSVQCEGSGCFAVWRDEPKGANAAYIDASNGTTIWRKRFAHRGTQVSVGLDGSGGGLLTWYQDGRVHVAPITRDGIGESSSVARVTGEQPAPSISHGKNHGEWIVAWTDYEAGHLELYVASVTCK
jgi:eukaryotic-like serine/threonine-protein kinase